MKAKDIMRILGCSRTYVHRLITRHGWETRQLPSNTLEIYVTEEKLLEIKAIPRTRKRVKREMSFSEIQFMQQDRAFAMLNYLWIPNKNFVNKIIRIEK